MLHRERHLRLQMLSMRRWITGMNIFLTVPGEEKNEAKKNSESARCAAERLVGDHDVIFAGTDEVVTFSHTAYSKAVFGKGAVAAAKFLNGKESGRFDMADVIG